MRLEPPQIKCHHGPAECRANGLHACIINQSVKNETLKLELLNCVSKKESTEASITECGNSLEIDVAVISKCYNTGQWEWYLAEFGWRTKKEVKRPPWVPWIFIDGVSISPSRPFKWKPFHWSLVLMYILNMDAGTRQIHPGRGRKGSDESALRRLSQLLIVFWDLWYRPVMVNDYWTAQRYEDQKNNW